VSGKAPEEIVAPSMPLRDLVAIVWSYLRPCRVPLAGSTALLFVAVPLAQIHPLVWRYVVDDVLPNRNLHGLIVALAIMLGAQFLAVSVGAWQSWLLEKSGQQFVRDLRNAVFARLIHQPLGYHQDRRTGDLVTRVVSDIDAMESSVLRDLSNLIEECLTFVVVASIVVALQPVVGLTTLIPLAMSFLLIRTFSGRIKSVYESVRKRLGDVGSFVNDRLGGAQLVQSLAREEDECKQFAGITEGYYQKSIRALRLRTLFFPAVFFGGFLSNVVMLGLGTWFIWRGEFTLGGLIAYRGYWWRLQSPISTIARMSDTLMRARAAAMRVVQVLVEPLAITSPAQSHEPDQNLGSVRFEAVEFAYATGKNILQNVSFEVEPGEMIAVAGRSGSGKTTLLNLIPRFYDVTGGRILVDGRDVREWPLNRLRQNIGLVLQETYLFNASVLENLRYSRPDASVADVETAARHANAHDFILNLPNGYDTVVGERGVKLSGGQKQRLSIARAFLANPTILLLDEPTSSVEPGSEEIIHHAILSLAEKRTTILVTHRVGLLRRAPRILFFDQGRVAGNASHDVLLATVPAYALAYEEWSIEEQLDNLTKSAAPTMDIA